MDERPPDTRSETPVETLARQLQGFRRRAGLTQEAIAERVRELGGSLGATAITRIETGKRDVSLEEALLLAAALGASPSALIVPTDDAAVDVRLTQEGEARPAGLVRAWFQGQYALDHAGPLSAEFVTRGDFETWQAEAVERHEQIRSRQAEIDVALVQIRRDLDAAAKLRREAEQMREETQRMLRSEDGKP